MKTVVVAKILHEELLRASLNFSSAHCLHHIMKIENELSVLKYGGGLALWLASRTTDQGSLVRDLAGSPFVVALSKSHLSPALYWLNPGSRGRTTDLDRM